MGTVGQLTVKRVTDLDRGRPLSPARLEVLSPPPMEHSPRFVSLVDSVKRNIREVTIDDVRARQSRGERFALIDVREDGEWSAGHIPGARHLGRGVLERDVEKAFPDTGTELILYCGGGYRSALAAESLQKMGYTRVFSMAGGWREWLASGGRTEK